MSLVSLKTKDEEIVHISRAAAFHSRVLQDALSFCSDTDEVIPVGEIQKFTLIRLVEALELLVSIITYVFDI